MGPRRRQGLRRPVQQRHRRARPGPARAGRQAVRRVEHASASSRSASGRRSTSTTSSSSITPGMENFWDRKLPLRRKGPIQLQTHGGEIRWRNVFVREIPPTRRTRSSASTARRASSDVFNGKDFAGWAGPVDNYEVKDGAIVCKPKKGGNIYTKEEYGDFVGPARVPAAAGRQQRPGDPLPRQGPAVARRHVRAADPRRRRRRSTRSSTRGSSTARPTAWSPAHRGYLRPAGEWNFMEVTVRGSTIQVELNGTRILDARPEQGDGVHGRQAAPRQGPHQRPLRLLRPQRPHGFACRDSSAR